MNFTSTGTEIAKETEKNIEIDKPSIYPLMVLDYETLQKNKFEYNNAEKAYIDPTLKPEIQATSSYSILHLLDYVPSERDQGWCSNCWAWPATSVMEIALNVQEGIFDRLSLQYLNSCGEIVGIECCEGGNLQGFARFYRKTGIAVPWSNDQAHWIDIRAQCRTPCDSIAKTPNYPISSMWTRTIETHEIPEEEAIENIKNVLHQQKGVYFSWILPDTDYREDFQDFWQRRTEDYIYDLDWDCGAEYSDTGGGHAILCVGYNDDQGTNNDYWIMLNSWGTTSNRPNALFAINMHMDYDCSVIYNENDYYSFDFETLNITFGSHEEAPDPPEIVGPSSGQTNTLYTYTISTMDNQGDDVYFYVNWDDNDNTGWIGPYTSEEEVELTHAWLRSDTYTIQVKAKDTNGEESLWSTLEVSMPRGKFVNTFFFRIFEKYPGLYKLFNALI